jgi:hypothetical protein
MVNKCVYCKTEVPEGRTMEICDRCGAKIWGEKMFHAIVEGTNQEKTKGNMELGQVSGLSTPPKKF